MSNLPPGLESLQFTVIYASSEHPDHPSSELNTFGQKSGWESAPNCSFPQLLVLKVHSDSISCTTRLCQLKILTHESKIAQKVEVFLASDAGRDSEAVGFDECRHIRRLGYVSLDSNQRSGYQARELKSIKVGNEEATFVKLVLHQCHTNNLNPDCQVGIVGISLTGYVEAKNIADSSMLICESTRETTGLQSSSQSKQRRPLHSLPGVPEQIEESLEPGIQVRLDKLAQVKQEMAAKEDFDGAAKVKVVLSQVNQLFDTLRMAQSGMNMAAANEDYAEASKLKIKRDSVRISALKALADGEKTVFSCGAGKKHADLPSCLSHAETVPSAIARTMNTPHLSSSQDFDDSTDQKETEMIEISATIRGLEDPILPKQGARTKYPWMKVEPEEEEEEEADQCSADDDESDVDRHDDGSVADGIRARVKPENNTQRAITINSRNFAIRDGESDEDEGEEAEDEESKREDVDEHELEGVPNYEALQAPEEINDEGGKISSDTIQRMETMIGIYRTKCFFSKQWALREAAVTKASMLVSTISQSMDIDAFSKSMCIMLEYAIDDRIVQVFISALILLDDALIEFEQSDLSQKDACFLLIKIISNLVSKLGDSNSKVVDGAETALMSLALSNCVGPSYIGGQVMKHMQEKGSRAGKAICSRFQFIRHIVVEFGEEGPSGETIMDFVREHGFGHKDAEVRDAAKSLSTEIYMILGSEIFSMLDGLNPRQLKEYKTDFAKAKKSRTKLAKKIKALPPTMGEDDDVDCYTACQGEYVQNLPNLQNTPSVNTQNYLEQMQVGTGKGRGRGRSRQSFGQEMNLGANQSIQRPTRRILPNSGEDDDADTNFR